MADPRSLAEIRCSLCDRPVSLSPTDTCSDEYGAPVHEECYLKRIAEGKYKPEPASANTLRSRWIARSG